MVYCCRICATEDIFQHRHKTEAVKYCTTDIMMTKLPYGQTCIHPAICRRRALFLSFCSDDSPSLLLPVELFQLSHSRVRVVCIVTIQIHLLSRSFARVRFLASYGRAQSSKSVPHWCYSAADGRTASKTLSPLLWQHALTRAGLILTQDTRLCPPTNTLKEQGDTAAPPQPIRIPYNSILYTARECLPISWRVLSSAISFECVWSGTRFKWVILRYMKISYTKRPTESLSSLFRCRGRRTMSTTATTTTQRAATLVD